MNYKNAHHSYKWCESACQCSCPEWLRPLERRVKAGCFDTHMVPTLSFGKIVQAESVSNHGCEIVRSVVYNYALKYKNHANVIMSINSKLVRYVKDLRTMEYVNVMTDVSEECSYAVYGCCNNIPALKYSIDPMFYSRMKEMRAALHADLLAWHWAPERMGRFVV